MKIKHLALIILSSLTIYAKAQEFTINSIPCTISQPGNYTLTKNINSVNGGAITVIANNVNIDLAGYTISSTAVNIIYVTTCNNVHIFNGTLLRPIPGASYNPGYLSMSSCSNCQIINMTAYVGSFHGSHNLFRDGIGSISLDHEGGDLIDNNWGSVNLGDLHSTYNTVRHNIGSINNIQQPQDTIIP